jgi:hypothetical protein
MINIVRGQTKALKFLLRGKTSGKPVDLTGATELVVSLPLETPADTFMVKKLSLTEISVGTDPKLGEVTVIDDLTTVETASLNPLGSAQRLKAVVTKGSDVKIYAADLLMISDL